MKRSAILIFGITLLYGGCSFRADRSDELCTHDRHCGLQQVCLQLECIEQETPQSPDADPTEMGPPVLDAQPMLDAEFMDAGPVGHAVDQSLDTAIEDMVALPAPDMSPDVNLDMSPDQAPPIQRGCQVDTVCISATADVFIDRQNENTNYNTDLLEVTQSRDVLLRFNMGMHQGVMPGNPTLILNVESWEPGTEVMLYQTHSNWDERIAWAQSPAIRPPGQSFVVQPEHQEVRWLLDPVLQSNLPLDQVVSLRLKTHRGSGLFNFTAHESPLMAPPLLEFSQPR